MAKHRRGRLFRFSRFVPSPPWGEPRPYEDMEVDPEMSSRRPTLALARQGDPEALDRLWKMYRVRLPLVEAATGWRPSERPLPIADYEPVVFREPKRADVDET